MDNSLIKRQDAIDLVRDVCDAIMSGCDSHYDSETGDEVYNDILEVDAILKCNKEIRIALANLPSAEPERKTGKWIHKHCVWFCSKCGENPTKGMGYVQGRDELYDFCPKCGADMRQGEYDNV